MSTKSSSIGTIVVWNWLRSAATATIVLLMIPYVPGWLAIAGWVIFGWHVLGILVDLISIGSAFNKLGTATRKRGIR